MSRSFVRASSQYLELASAVVTAVPLTMACWVYSTDDTVAQCLMSIGASANDNNAFFLDYNGAAGGDPLQAYTIGSSQAFSASTTTALTKNVWHHACGVWAATNDRRVYLDGGGKGTNTGNAPLTGLNRTGIGRLSRLSPADYTSGNIAEAAMWSAILTDTDVAVLAAGFSPQFVRPDALVAYWPLLGRFSPEIDLWRGNGLTVTGATAGDHPRIIYPGFTRIGRTASSGTTQLLAASVTGLAAASGSLEVTRLLAATSAGIASIGANLEATHLLISAIAGLSAISANGVVTHLLESAIAELSTVTGTLFGEVLLGATVSALTSSSGNLEVTRALQAVLSATGSVAATLEVTRGLAGAAICTAVVSGNLEVTRLLSAFVTGETNISAILSLSAATLPFILTLQARSFDLTTPIRDFLLTLPERDN